METIKYFKPLYVIYFWVGSLVLNLIKMVIKPDERLILFISFGGKKFDDSPRVIYDQMTKDKRYNNYKLVWAFHNPDEFSISRGMKIKTDSFRYFITALKARCWITNSRVERGLSFKGKNTFYFNTWHGTPIKKMGIDISNGSKSFGSRAKWNVDLMTSQSKYEADIFSRVFNIDREKFLVCGLPRNDSLTKVTAEDKREMMKKLELPLDKKVILYAPTFREFERDNQLNCVISPPINFEKWESKLGNEFIVLLRAHYEVVEILNTNMDNKFVYDVSNYPVLNDLIVASDMLISDYSSMFFDYSILDKPMICYAYDYIDYEVKRGLYFDIRKVLPGGTINENELIELIKNAHNDYNKKLVRDFRDKYVEEYGNGVKVSLDTIYKNLRL
jgi:CDP-glycerol glycerophosphotransferase